MNKRDVHRLIEERDSEAKENLRKMTEEKSGISLSRQSEPEKQTQNIRKFCTAFATAVSAVCLLIALPFLLKGGYNAAKDSSRYCTAEEYTERYSDSDYTLKKYSRENGNNILYLDMYDSAAETATQIYVSVNDATDIIFFRETIYLEDTYDEIDLYITDDRTTVDVLEGISEYCIESLNVNGISCSWGHNNKKASVIFEYKGYRYFIMVYYPIEERDITQMITSMM